MELSIVSTMYYSAPYLEEFYHRACTAAKQITDDYEIVFVNDGSPDSSLAVALSLYECDERVKVVDLSRNFGQHKAMMTGLAHSCGDLVFLTDSDLELAPEMLNDFYAVFDQNHIDVVYGVQDKRQDPIFDRLAANAFYFFFNLLSPDPLPVNLTTARLMSRRYVSALVAHQEREVLIGGLWQITGFLQMPVTVRKSNKGKTTYGVGRRLTMLVNAVTSFSNRPLILIFYLGVVISLLAGLAAVYLLIQRVFFGVFLAGWPSLIVSIWLLGGLTILCLGVIGIYLSKVYLETKQRPYTIVRAIYSHGAEDLGCNQREKPQKDANRVCRWSSNTLGG